MVPVRAQEVRVQENRALRLGSVGRPEDVLVLEAGVPELEPAVAAAPRSARARIVPQLRQPLPDRLPCGEPRRGRDSVSSFSAAIHARVAGASASSSGRYGSAIGVPW